MNTKTQTCVHWAYKQKICAAIVQPSRQAEQNTCHQDMVISVTPPADAPPHASSLETCELLPETSVPPSVLECANVPPMATVKSRALKCRSTICCPRNPYLPSSDFERWGKARVWKHSSGKICLVFEPIYVVRRTRLENERCIIQRICEEDQAED